MSVGPIPSELSIALEGVCVLSVECWRLRRISEFTKDAQTKAGLRHAVRHVTDALAQLGIEVIDFAGRAYDAGMVPEVVEIRHDPQVPDGQAVVDETVSPTITWSGRVVDRGQIIVKRSGAPSEHSNEVLE